MPKFTVPTLFSEEAARVLEPLSDRLIALIDLSLTLKPIHWNGVGPYFIGAHELLDRQLGDVREMVDALAERIATMGGTPIGTPRHLFRTRDWDDYALSKATVPEHLAALDVVYSGIIAGHREAQQITKELDPVSEDLLISQLRQLELLQWLVRAHLESSAGAILTVAKTETAAAKAKRAFAG